MNCILLQHYTGALGELEKKSMESMQKYAASLGADYQFVRGNVFNPNFQPPCQKLIMLDECYDDYDVVVMTDMDMFVRKGTTENIFETKGYGRHTEVQDDLVAGLARRKPNLANVNHPYWGGSTYRLPRELRIKLRRNMSMYEMAEFNHDLLDEGMMHRLAVLAKLPITDETYFEGNKWNCGNFEDNVSEANFIHIRYKKVQGGEKYPKIEQYKDMVAQGLIDD